MVGMILKMLIHPLTVRDPPGYAQCTQSLSGRTWEKLSRAET